MRLPIPLPLALIVGFALVAPTLAAAQDNATLPGVPAETKQRGTPDSSTMEVDLQSPTAATLTMEQTWEGARADAFRQSLDAYFGNGDGTLTTDEVQKVTNASEHDMINKTFPPVGIDGQVATVASVQVTMDGAVAAVNGTSVTLHHSATLSFSPRGGDEHNVTIVPLWDGQITVSAPSGFVLVAPGESSGVQTQPAQATAKTPITFTLRPASTADEPTTTPTHATATPAANNSTAESVKPAPNANGITGLVLLGAAVAVAIVAFLAWRRPKPPRTR